MLVSTDGGRDPSWSREGKELFYLHVTAMMSVHFAASESEFLPEKPVLLPVEGAGVAGAIVRFYDVAPDGRFLVVRVNPEQAEERLKKIFPSTLRVVLNGAEELQRLLAGR